jgi:phospholipid/cholesterol/gamma-HCH transport system substrate-binding protein
MSNVRYPLLGLAVVGVVALLVFGTVASFTQMFTPSVDVLVRTDRSGLLMDPGADVSLRGLSVGSVRSVEPDGTQALLRVALDPDRVARIPSGVTASIVAPTVFGAKYVQLDPPAAGIGSSIQAPSRHVTAGSVIEAGTVATEANNVLSGLFDLLDRVDVAQLNSGLGALSTTLNGRGQQLGELLVQLHRFLDEFNPSLPALRRDVSGIADVMSNLADVAPDLLAVLDNASITSKTLVDEKPALTTMLTDLLSTANNSRALLEENGPALQDTLSTLTPTSSLLARYSPMFPCLFATSNQLRRDIEPAIGGEFPGIHTFTSFQPGIAGYHDPGDLPEIVDTSRPSCFGGPIGLRPGDDPYPHVSFDDGSQTFKGGRTDDFSPQPDPLPVVLFGDAARELGR